ncbi:MAG: formate/nitrite transporter family protein [Alistipes sp.]|nr:formate/nitrite transporter family protein [Alistipes sp.]
MKELLNLTKRSICAGLLIGCAGFAYSMVGGIVGAFLFSFGLFGVLYGNWSLYTGYAGSFAWREVKDWGLLFYILAGNWVGVMALALIVAASSDTAIVQANEVVSKIIADRTSSEWWQILVRAIGTGFIMEIAVRYGRENKWMTVLFGVPVFIVCGLPHCVADIFYYGVDWITANGDATAYILPWAFAILGNLIGCNIPRLLTVRA